MNPWFRMASDTAFMMWDAQQVMALHVMRLATGGPGAWLELPTSATEKVETLATPNVARVAEFVDQKSLPAAVKKVVRKSHDRLKATKSRPTKSPLKKRKSPSK
jgi:hypothetical protein